METITHLGPAKPLGSMVRLYLAEGWVRRPPESEFWSCHLFQPGVPGGRFVKPDTIPTWEFAERALIRHGLVVNVRSMRAGNYTIRRADGSTTVVPPETILWEATVGTSYGLMGGWVNPNNAPLGIYHSAADVVVEAIIVFLKEHKKAL